MYDVFDEITYNKIVNMIAISKISTFNRK